MVIQQSFLLDLHKENRVIRGEVRVPQSLKVSPTIIICHGFKAFKDWGFFPTVAQRIAEAGFSVITFNFSMNGIGDQPEEFSELELFAHQTFTRQQEDLSFLLTQLKNKKLPYPEALDSTRIGLLGHSRGGGDSLIFALDSPDIEAVAVWNSIHRPDFFAKETIQTIYDQGGATIVNARTHQELPIDREVLDDIEQHRERYDFLKRLPQLQIPLLLVQGDQDHPGFFEGAKTMAQAAPHASLHVVKGATHTMGAVHPFAGTTPQLEEAIQETIHFFKNIW
ncbi:alpha/beta hydrolase family protein [Hazenella coriacea]|uniref:PET hydrolase/cutinase-like domain-containing protein n=1 Tax=Hazenella coriacea TaxID=1179467 RepID=A0A4V2UVI4_9BACL|nr:alpha/beta fold hydrolase [Hazenella coriacea]TCS95917.1 hypothetical protein EDD58_102500 [Hazenella coriacea]